MSAQISTEILLALRQPNIEEPVRQLYQAYSENIVSHICANGGSREDGCDIFQEAILVLIDKVRCGQFREESNLKTFLTGIARNLWLFEMRTRGRRKNRESFYMADEEKIVPGSDHFYEKKFTVTLESLFEKIGAACQKLLTGFYYEEKSMKELLAEFNYENDQVLRNKKSKCMKKLKELINEDQSLLQQLKSKSIYG